MADATVIADRYELREELGRGGFGAVWRGYDRTLGRDVAVKLVSFDVLSDPDGAMARFRQEARAVAGFNHPNIVTAHDFGEHDGSAYLVMELITGGSLADELAASRHAGQVGMSVARVKSVADQVCAGLEVAHAAGLVHRDLKPANLMLAGSTGTVKIVDFGIVWVDRESRLTQDGDHLGTLRYAAPEQLDTGSVDGRADLYSLGCVLYETLAGRSPYRAETPADWIAAHLSADPIQLRAVRPEVPDGLAGVIHRMLAKDPAHRPADAAAVRVALAAPDEVPIIGRARFGGGVPAAIAATPAGRHRAAGSYSTDSGRTAKAGVATPERSTTPGGVPMPDGSGTSDGSAAASAAPQGNPLAAPDRPATRPYTAGYGPLFGSGTAAGPATAAGAAPCFPSSPAVNAPTSPSTPVPSSTPQPSTPLPSRPAAFDAAAAPGRSQTPFDGHGLPPYPHGPRPRNSIATAALLCGILPLPPFGFVVGLVGLVRSRRLAGAGRVRAALGILFAVLWSFPIGGAVASGLSHLSHRLDPGCISVGVYTQQFDARLHADGNDAHAIVVELTTAAAELRADANKSSHAKTAADMRAAANDLDQWRAAIRAGRRPSAALVARLQADPGIIQADCT